MVIVSPLVRFRAVDLLTTIFDRARAIRFDKELFQLYDTATSYTRKLSQIVHNMRLKPAIAHLPHETILVMRDEERAEGTMIEAVQENERKRCSMLERLLREKCEDVDSYGAEGPLRCRTCGSSSVVWDQKQTRGADESSTLFCSCTQCKSRWRMS